MSNKKLVVIDKDIIMHLRLNGSMRDQMGTELTNDFISTALTIKEIKEAAQQFGFTHDDLCCAFVSMIEVLKKNPTIKVGLPMLAATLAFVEPHRIKMVMEFTKLDEHADTTLQERKSKIVELAEETAVVIWRNHTHARGECEFNVIPYGTGISERYLSGKSGCASLIIFGAMGAVLWAAC